MSIDLYSNNAYNRKYNVKKTYLDHTYTLRDDSPYDNLIHNDHLQLSTQDTYHYNELEQTPYNSFSHQEFYIIIHREDTMIDYEKLYYLNDKELISTIIILQELLGNDMSVNNINSYMKSRRCIYLPIRESIDYKQHQEITSIFSTYEDIRIICPKPIRSLDVSYLRVCNDIAILLSHSYLLLVI